ncbi:MAG: hypothetical protein L6V93_17895 [Clostridiales bacterium]|nr:MAG: hypothetical protein L6V93_17895 [Clostridiales bacterium]
MYIIFFRFLKPIIATIGILAFQGSWNEYLMPTLFTLTRPRAEDSYCRRYGAQNFGRGGVVLEPYACRHHGCAHTRAFFAYAVGNKYFVKGIASGAVKRIIRKLKEGEYE